MFKKDLIELFQNIFEIKKVTFDAPSDQYEQDCLFISITQTNPRASNKKFYFKAIGSITIYCRRDKLTYGYFSRMIERHADIAGKLFFSNIDNDLENSPARMQNIHEIRTDFLYLWEGQYDPNKGELTSLQFL